MSGDVFVSFGADTGNLEAGIALAKAETKALASEVRTLAAEMQKTGASADSELGARLNDVADKFARAKERARDFSAEMRGIGDAAGDSGGFAQIREMVEGLTSPLTAVRNNLGEIAELFGSAFAVEKFVDLAKEMGELGESTERTSKILGLSTEEVGRLNYQMALTGTSAERLDMVMGRFEVGLNQAASTGAGRVAEGLHALGISASELVSLRLPEQLEKIADAVASFQDSPTKTAAVQSLGRGFLELLPLLDEGGAKMREFSEAADRTNSVLSQGQTGALVAMQRGFADLKSAVAGAAELGFQPFILSAQGATAILRDLATEFADSVKQGGPIGELLKGLAITLQLVETAAVGAKQALEAMWDVLKTPITVPYDYLESLAHSLADLAFGKLGDAAKHLKDANEGALKDVNSSYDEWIAAGKRAKAELDKIWESETEAKKASDAVNKPLVSPMDTSEIGKLKAQIDDLTDSIEKAKLAAAGGIDVGALVGSGAQTPVAPGPGAMSMQKMAGLARGAGFEGQNLATIVAIAQAESSGMPGATNANSNGTTDYGLTQINSSHGADYARGALDPQTAFTEAFSVSKSGTDFSPWATYKSGAYGKYMNQASAAAAGAGGEDLEAKQQKLTEARTKLFELEQQKGGSEASKAKLQIAEAEAAQKQNAVAMAEKEAAAAQKDVDAAKAAGIEQTKINALEENHAAAAGKVREAKDAQAESAARLSVAQARVTGDVKATFEAETRLANLKLRAAGADPAGQNEAKAQLLAARQTYDNAVRQESMETAQGEIDAARQAAQGIREQLDERLKTHRLTNQQWLAATRQAFDQEAAAVRAAYGEELAIANQTSAQKIKIAQDEKTRLAQIANDETKAQNQSAESTQKEWDSVAHSIMGAFNSALTGMISGHETFGQAMAKLGEDLGMKLLEALEKTLIEGQLANFLSSLFSGLGGLGGFGALLAPLAIVGADIGMWEVPQNQLMMIHKNELVMPASEAGAFRSMLSGQAQSPGLAASAGTHVGGDVHAHFHVNAIDSGSVKSFFANHSRHILAALNGGVRNGDHIGLRSIGAFR